MITVVTGVQRSGKAMLMQMLRAGGMELSYDPKYLGANDLNENGFFEHKHPGDLLCDPAFRESIDGKAINVVGHELPLIPYFWRVNMRAVWIERPFEPTWKSRMRVEGEIDWDEYLVKESGMIEMIYREIKTFNKHIRVDYDNIVNSPRGAALDLAVFLKMPNFKIDAAAAVVERRLRHYE